jgi:phospholipid/cholesterol/gamma-HCH transport system permease protein
VATLAYAGGVTLLLLRVPLAILRPDRDAGRDTPGFARTLVHELFWMMTAGLPLVGLVHIAMGSFLSLQAYYGSTFVEGTGAVVGVGLLRNLGGMMTGLTLAGMLAARMIPELRARARPGAAHEPPPATVAELRRPAERALSFPEPAVDHERIAAPRIMAAAFACVFLAQWGVAVGTVVGWQASLSMMGLPTETFFLMMSRMMWFRDVVGLLGKGVLYGALPAAICCHEGLRSNSRENEPGTQGPGFEGVLPGHGAIPPWTISMFRAACLSFVVILIVNTSWFILVYHAVPFYGPTLLSPPGP